PREHFERSLRGGACDAELGAVRHANRDRGGVRLLQPVDIEEVIISELNAPVVLDLSERHDVDLDAEHLGLVLRGPFLRQMIRQLCELVAGADSDSDVDIFGRADRVALLKGMDGEIASRGADDEEIELDMVTELRQ